MKSAAGKLFLLFNHRLTPEQECQAREGLRVAAIKEPPEEIVRLWASIPADLEKIDACLDPVKEWLDREAEAGDYLLVQGDFGATYLMVRHALKRALTPLYSTTRREATEETREDGSVKLVHRFLHRRFRVYGK